MGKQAQMNNQNFKKLINRKHHIIISQKGESQTRFNGKI